MRGGSMPAGLHRLKQELERDLSDSGRPGIRDKTETSADVPGWSKKLRWESSEAPAGLRIARPPRPRLEELMKYVGRTRPARSLLPLKTTA